MSEQMKSVRVVISGRVQGVWYRAWTQQTAQNLGIKGWVRNRSDGTVEAVFYGVPAKVDAMLKACRKGPTFARVDDIFVQDDTPPVNGEGADVMGFEKRPTL